MKVAVVTLFVLRYTGESSSHPPVTLDILSSDVGLVLGTVDDFVFR